MSGASRDVAGFAVRLEESPAGAVVWARGELDLAAAGILRRTLVEAAAHGRVVLDLTDVAFVDGSALGAIVAARKEAGDDAEIVLRHPKAVVSRVLRLTALDESFPVERERPAGDG